MSADVDILRRAAARMRELAEAARTSGRWESESDDGGDDIWATDNDGQPHLIAIRAAAADAAHIAAWDPTVALAVADWLESHTELVVEEHTDCGLECTVYDAETDPALAVARAFLRESAP